MLNLLSENQFNIVKMTFSAGGVRIFLMEDEKNHIYKLSTRWNHLFTTRSKDEAFMVLSMIEPINGSEKEFVAEVKRRENLGELHATRKITWEREERKTG